MCPRHPRPGLTPVPHGLADSNQRIRIREKTLEFSSTVLSTLSTLSVRLYINKTKRKRRKSSKNTKNKNKHGNGKNSNKMEDSKSLYRNLSVYFGLKTMHL